MVKSVEILKTARAYDGFFKLDKVRLRHTRYDGSMSEPMERLVFERGDAVAVMLYHRQRDAVLLVEQFRCPTYLRGDDGWLLETVAGVLEDGKGKRETAQQELLEEAGYQVAELIPLYTFYPSPGACTERITFYLGYLDDAQRRGPGGGLASEHEDIRLVEMPFEEAWVMLQGGQIRDAKTIIGLQQVALLRMEQGQ